MKILIYIVSLLLTCSISFGGNNTLIPADGSNPFLSAEPKKVANSPIQPKSVPDKSVRPLMGKNVNVYLEGKSQSYPIRDFHYNPQNRQFLKPESGTQYRGQSPEKTLITPWQKGPLTITPYGFLNIAAIFETERTTTGDYALYTNRPDSGDNDPAFFIDVKTSRLGFKIDGPGVSCLPKSRGVFEFDFQGSFAMRNRPGFQLRKAYIELYNQNTRLLAGQDWEIVSPLYPNMLNYVPACLAGNLGYRRAQLRVDHTQPLGSDTKGVVQFALCDGTPRYIYAQTPNSMASSWPLLEGRIAVSFGEHWLSAKKPITIGVSAHFGQERFNIPIISSLTPLYSDELKNTWSLNGDFDFPITKMLRLQSELFIGENLTSVEGGIAQGIDIVTRNGIGSKGGWIALQYLWNAKFQTNVGYAIDDPKNSDVVYGSADGNSRTRNEVFFVNGMYNWTAQLMSGLEISYWQTQWQSYNNTTKETLDLGKSDSVRFETVARYSF